MTEKNLLLYAATYADDTSASEDYQALKDAQADGDIKVVGSVVLDRDDAGKVTVREQGAGFVPAGAAIGGLAGLVIGLFAPPLLLATAVGAGIGAGIGELVKKHEEGQLGLELEGVLPPGASAIVAVVDVTYADRVDAALGKATKRLTKAIDSGDYEAIKKAIVDAGHTVDDAVES